MREFLEELRRRKIWWVSGVYLGAGWLVVQIAVVMEASFSLPDWLDMITIVLVAVGFPFAIILA